MTTPQPPTLIGNLYRGSGNDSGNLDIIFSLSTTQPNMGSFSYPANKKNIFNEYSRSFTFICDIWALYVNFRNGNIKNIVGDTSIVNIPYTEFAFKQSWDHNMETYQWNALNYSHHFDYASIMNHLAELGDITSALSIIDYMINMRVIDIETIHCLRDDISMFFESVNLKLSLTEFKQIPRAVMGKPLLKRLGKEIPKKKEDFPVCVICMDNIKSRQHTTVLDCCHLYHIDCAKQWFTKHCEKPTCCSCRAEIHFTRDIDSHPEVLSEPMTLPNSPIVLPIIPQLNFDDIMSESNTISAQNTMYESMPELESDDEYYDIPPLISDEISNELYDIPDHVLMDMMDRVEANFISNHREPINQNHFTQNEINELDFAIQHVSHSH